MKYFLAFLACLAIAALYVLLGSIIGWKHGGGVIPMMILMAVLIGTWRSITTKRKELHEEINENQEDDSSINASFKPQASASSRIYLLILLVVIIILVIYAFSIRPQSQSQNTTNYRDKDDKSISANRNANDLDSPIKKENTLTSLPSGTQDQSNFSPSPTYRPYSSSTQFTDPQVQPFNEIKPPKGDTKTLSQEQINFCVAEEIRLDAAYPFVDKSNNAQTNYYNSLIDDYNGRCINFSYVPGTLDRAHSNAVSHRERLEKEGQDRVLKYNSRSNQTSNPFSSQSYDLPVVKLSPGKKNEGIRIQDSRVADIQWILLSKGYYNGNVDGIYGPKTRTAILNYQRDNGLEIDGLASELLRNHFKTH